MVTISRAFTAIRALRRSTGRFCNRTCPPTVAWRALQNWLVEWMMSFGFDRAERLVSAQIVFGPPIDGLLDRLYAQDAAQNDAMASYFAKRAAEGSLDWRRFDERTNAFLKDKLVALERPKAEFCYQLCRALGARRVVEAGTSFGVSTLFLAAAVRANGGGTVIATENEAEKAAIARKHFDEARLSQFIELRVGDLCQTLGEIAPPIDFMFD